MTQNEVVYAIGSAHHAMVKIGTTVNLSARLAAHQTSSPFPLVVLWTHQGGAQLERRLHSRLRSYRVHGEWFDFGSEDPVRKITESLALVVGDGRTGTMRLGGLAFSAHRFQEERAKRDALREELASAIHRADGDGVPQKDICEVTGYTRQQVRRIVIAEEERLADAAKGDSE